MLLLGAAGTPLLIAPGYFVQDEAWWTHAQLQDEDSWRTKCGPVPSLVPPALFITDLHRPVLKALDNANTATDFSSPPQKILIKDTNRLSTPAGTHGPLNLVRASGNSLASAAMQQFSRKGQRRRAGSGDRTRGLSKRILIFFTGTNGG